MTRSITVPRSDLHNTRIVIYRNLEYRYQLQPNAGNTTFIKKTGQIGILRYLRKYFHGINRGTTSRNRVLGCNVNFNFSTVLQTELSKVALLLHSGKLTRTTCTVETGTSVPSIGTSSGSTISAVNHSKEW